jgi:hypothetical protein
MGIKIPVGIKSVPHADGKNIMFQHGPILCSDTGSSVMYTEEEYKQAFGKQDIAGQWCWKQTVEDWTRCALEMFAD